MRPYSTSGANRYCRLLPSSVSGPRLDEYYLSLYKLGIEMKDDGSDLSKAPESLPFAGYTYFGQFVDHDLTRDKSSLDEAFVWAPEENRNHQTPFLDLDHLYGKGPFHPADKRLYEAKDVRLRRSPPNGRAGGRFDVATDDAGVPLVADERTVDNVILRQVAAVFVHLHNCAVEQWRTFFEGDLPGLFEQARLQTTWQYQWLICEDFLMRLLDHAIYKSVFRQHRPLIKWGRFSIPVEFSAAAMRFGHSVVRERYSLSQGIDKNLRDLFAPELHAKALPTEYEIDWGFFFQAAGSVETPLPVNALVMRPIDTRISLSLHHIPSPTKRLYNPSSKKANDLLPPEALDSLPVRTLFRGAALGLRDGQTIASALGESVLHESELTLKRDGEETAVGNVLLDEKLAGEAPLWYYILKESEVRHNGNRIGPTGSRIIAETIHGALLSDSNSIFNHSGADVRQPPIWKIGSKEYSFTSLQALFRAAPLFAGVERRG
jgi:hypothetical protein